MIDISLAAGVPCQITLYCVMAQVALGSFLPDTLYIFSAAPCIGTNAILTA